VGRGLGELGLAGQDETQEFQQIDASTEKLSSVRYDGELELRKSFEPDGREGQLANVE
jgi:hypothetical protein